MTRRSAAGRRAGPLALAATLTLAAACGSGGDTGGAGSGAATPATIDVAAPWSGSTLLATAPSATPAPPAAVAAVASQALLDAVGQTIFGQPLAYPAGSARVSSAIITLQPGAATGMHRHDAPMYAYVLDGEVTVTYDGGVVKTYPAGSAMMEAVGTAHDGRNTGTVPVRILVVNIGADGVANTVRL
jgi:quercetin dioxygenase-like cupin family protein